MLLLLLLLLLQYGLVEQMQFLSDQPYDKENQELWQIHATLLWVLVLLHK